MNLSNAAHVHLRTRAVTIGRVAVACASPADAAIAMLYEDISFLTANGTEAVAASLALELGRELLAYCFEHFGPDDLDRLRVLMDEILAEAKGVTE